MKKIKRNIVYVITLFSLIFLSACELEEANNNPNDLVDVPSYVLLPYVESRIADLSGGSAQVISGVYINYITVTKDNYLPTMYLGIYKDHNDGIWSGYYSGAMMNARKMIDIAEVEGNYYYTGIGKILLALCIGNVTTLYGEVPYSEALKSSDNLNPKFDNQESIYESIQSLLDEGISDFRKPELGLKPGAYDYIFNGDTTKWIKTAYALKARYYIHLTKRTADLSFNPAEKALEAVNNALATSSALSSDDLEYHYTYSAANINPFNPIIKDLEVDVYFSNLMSSTMDPRRNYYYKKQLGVAKFTDSSYFSSKTSPVLLMTQHELKLIEAEARLRINESDPLAEVALKDAVTLSINKTTKGKIAPSEITDYLNSQVVLSGTFEDKLKTIITQKYIALFASQEPWSDYRRTGYPVLTPNPGGDNLQNPGGAIPRRFPYPLIERTNLNIPNPIPTMQDRFWWDQD